MKPHQLDYALRIRLPIVLFVVAAAYIATYYFSRAERDGVGYAPAQPIAFSHRLHAGDMQIDCKYCHTGVTVSAHASVPPVATCMNCHTVARKNKPEILKLARYYETGEPVPWKRIHRVPDFAYFNHSVHVNKGIPCQQCHGEVQAMDVVSQVSSFTMASCLDCHRNAPQILSAVPGIKKAPEHCNTCHR